MTMRVPNPKKSRAQLAMERAIASADSISISLRKALEGAGKALTQEPGVTQLSQISPALGDITSGAFWALDDNGKPRMVMSAESLFEALGVSAYFAGLDANGVPQFWMDADTGAAVFAGGRGKIGDVGLQMSGGYYGLNFIKQNYPTSRGEAQIRISQEEVGRLRLTFMDELGTTNLVSNGDAETGTTAGWTQDARLTAVSDGVYAGQYCFQLDLYSSSGAFYSDYVALASPAGKALLVEAMLESVSVNPPQGDSYSSVYGQVLFYDDSNTWIPSGSDQPTYFLMENSTCKWSSRWALTKIPAGATKFRIKLEGGGAIIKVDNIQARMCLGWTYFLGMPLANGTLIDGGATFGRWGATKSAGVTKNRNTTGTFNLQTCLLRTGKTLRIKEFLWYVRKAGTYELYFMYGPGTGNVLNLLDTHTTAVDGITMFFYPPGGLVLPPGSYYFAIKKAGAAVLWSDNSNAKYEGDDFVLDGVSYDGTAFSYTAPLQLKYNVAEFF